MSILYAGLTRWMQPIVKPAVSYCWNLVRNFANHRHKKILKLAKGYRGRANSCYTVAFHRVQKARQYQYRDRKTKKREFRSLWIQRINAASRIYGLPYSVLMNSLQRSAISLNRKVLADVAATEPLSFKSIIEVAKQSSKKANS